MYIYVGKWQLTPTQIKLIDTWDKSLYIPVIRPWRDPNLYSAPNYWFADQRLNQLSHSKAQ